MTHADPMSKMLPGAPNRVQVRVSCGIFFKSQRSMQIGRQFWLQRGTTFSFAMMALRFLAFPLVLHVVSAVLLFRRAQHAGQRVQFQEQQGGLSAEQADAGWQIEVPVLPLCGVPEDAPQGVGDEDTEAKADIQQVPALREQDHEPAVDSSEQVAPLRDGARRGRKRKNWSELEVVQKPDKLRVSAQKWLQEKKHLHSVLTSSTWCGKRTYLAKCRMCKDCTFEWCFSERSDGSMVVEVTGACTENKNVKAAQRQRAKELAQSRTPAQAQKQMEQQQIPVQERPPAWQIQNYRPQKRQQVQKQAADCLLALRAFLQSPPETLRVDTDSLVCNEEQVRILFAVPEATEWFQTCNLPWFLCDFTMKTNKPGLVLGAIGPVGLKRGAGGRPHLRFVPVQYMLSHTEDQEAHSLLVKKYVQMAADAGIQLTDGIFDCACYAGAKAALSGEGMPQNIFLHRCLQHTKENLKEEAKKRDEATGQPRLSNGELLPLLVELLQFSAWLPSDEDAR